MSTKKDRHSNKEAPLVVKLLSDHVREWRKNGNDIMIILQDSPLESIKVRFPPIFMGFEARTEFYISLAAVSSNEMSEGTVELYQRLKGMECKLSYRGLFRKEPVFKVHDSLRKLSSLVPRLVISQALRDFLSQDRILMEILEKTKPDSLEVLLSSFDPAKMPYMTQPYDPIPLIVDFFLDPPFISWEICVSKMTQFRFKARRHYIGMIRSLERTAYLVDYFTSGARLSGRVGKASP